jgi:hypothetical protein
VACETCERLKTKLIGLESSQRAYRWFIESKGKSVRQPEVRRLRADEAQAGRDLDAARLELERHKARCAEARHGALR